MNSKVKLLIFLLAFAVLIGGAALAYGTLIGGTDVPDALSPVANPNASNDADNIAPGDDNDASSDDRILAPDFTVVDADGNEVKLSELFGKPIVMNFWTSWCPPCKAEMPEFDKVYKELGETVNFMMIDLVDGQQETKEKGQQHIAAQGFTFPVYYDVTGEAGYIYGIRSIPETLFIDKDGYIITGAQGAIDEATLRKGISFISD